MAEKRQTEHRSEPAKGQAGLQTMPERNREVSTWRDPFQTYRSGPFGWMRQMQEEMDRVFNSFSGGRGWLAPFDREAGGWAPPIDIVQRGDDLIVRADVPGLSREDLSVEVGDQALTIRGERKYEHEDERDGVFRRERSYGSFCRLVPLPEGTVAESAKANFNDGVLEVVIKAPPQETRRGRRIEIGQGRSDKNRQEK